MLDVFTVTRCLKYRGLVKVKVFGSVSRSPSVVLCMPPLTHESVKGALIFVQEVCAVEPYQTIRAL